MSKKMKLLKDRKGIKIPIGSIIFGTPPDRKEKHYFNFGLCQNKTSYEMIACTYGYVHNVTQENLVDFELIGCLDENIDLLNCD